MKRVTYIWIEPTDKAFVNSVKVVGVRQVARRAGVSASMLSRWVRGQTGMIESKACAVGGAVNEVLGPLASAFAASEKGTR